jgi:iron-sulfur cluster repair protein YtfE (RIC family)
MEGEQKSPGEGSPSRGRFTIVYLIHEAFRRDLTRLSSALRAPGVDQRRARQLGAHWTFVDDQLHHHHQVEDASLWPLVRPKLSGREEELTVLAQMEAQHLVLVPQCEAIGEGFASLAQQPGEPAARALAGAIDELGTELASHLADEEQRCFPVIDQALSADEFESFGKATAKAIGMRGSARFFPWIFDGADPIERTAVLSMPPPPVRVLCRTIWEPRYARTVATLWS